MLGLKPTLTPLEQKHQTEHLVSKYLVVDSSLRCVSLLQNWLNQH